jgi:serine phosphatase RsbU (regulator of sigma subunit)
MQKEQERTFTKHELKIETPTMLYAFSDGYPDQFGGKDGRKLTIKVLKELLLEIHQKPIQEQKNILDTTMRNWKGTSHKQIDDMLMIGMKLA